MEYIYLQGESNNRSEINIQEGIQEIRTIMGHQNQRELYNIQQLIYGNTAYLYRLLHLILSLFQETFNPNSYYNNEGYDYSKISNLISNLLNSSDFNENDQKILFSHISHIDQSLIKFHSILLNIYDIKTSTACHNLRNYFSITPPNKSLKMSEYVTENHSSQRIALFQTLTKNPTAFKHLFLTSSIKIDKSPSDSTGNITKEKVRIHFRENNIDLKDYFDLRINGIGVLYYDLLSAIIHDAIPNYTKPDDISKRYLATNTLCTIIVMESLLIHWKNLSKCLKCFYANWARKYTFSELIYEIFEKVSEDSPIHNNVQNLHIQFMRITEAIEKEKERYMKNFANYIKYLQREPQPSYSPIIHKRYSL